ncbi:hypothetical protein FHL15_006243 [Xylaria flabelliformis]|uniref:Uncharacterized protein n=1 Tax=Xylaria flabelliformis TaxID=2512241 RepID=A0A553HY16_9PEZI|nr:hypothetical protein FHL15_006243 [Xylaria flabelliformis]
MAAQKNAMLIGVYDLTAASNSGRHDSPHPPPKPSPPVPNPPPPNEDQASPWETSELYHHKTTENRRRRYPLEGNRIYYQRRFNSSSASALNSDASTPAANRRLGGITRSSATRGKPMSRCLWVAFAGLNQL